MHVQDGTPSMMLQQTPQTLQTMHVMKDKLYDTSPSAEKTVEEVLYLFHTMAQRGGIGPIYKMFNSKPFRESLSIPNRIWNELEPMIKDKIIATRANLRKKNEESKKIQQTIPSQYPTMAAKVSMLNLVSSLADCGIYDNEDTDDDFLYETSAMRVRVSADPPEENLKTDIEVRAHFEYTHMPELKSIFSAISDSGADSCVLGKIAKVLSFTGRYASLIGYDPKNTIFGRVPIVTALLKV